MSTKILLLEDSQSFAKSITDEFAKLGESGYEVVHVEQLEDAVAVVHARPFDVILTSLIAAGSEGKPTVSTLLREAADVPILVLAASDQEELAEDAVRTGAKDYLFKKSCDSHTLRRAVTYAIERQQFESDKGGVSNHDPLTGLPNRNLFSDRLEVTIVKAAKRDENFAIHFIDIDDFKAVNDTHGHAVADKLLSEVAKRLKGELRKGEMLARFGGDEFVVVQTQLDGTQESTDLARRMLDALRQPLDLDGKEFITRATIGIALYPKDGEDPDKLLEVADEALRSAKQSERGSWQYYDSELSSRLRARRDLEDDLRKAIESQELVVHYQPQLDLKSGKIAAIEALVRWQKSDGVFVAPVEFIPIAELTGLIGPLGRFVMEQACSDAVAWRNATDSDLKVSVNISPVQVREAGLVAEVSEILRRTNAPAKALEIEVGETAILKLDETRAHDVLGRLRALGIGINLDDFGTALASLGYIQRFPFTKMKVDRTFVDLINKDENATQIVEAIIQLGKQKKLVIVAEGVETEEQRDFLRAKGCDLAQGYFFCRPVPANEISALLRADAPKKADDPLKGLVPPATMTTG